MSVGKRQQLLTEVAQVLVQKATSHPLRVAIDGIDAAGKTCFAKELTEIIEQSGHPALHISLDGFHNPRRVRYARGSMSPEGYFQDSFDLEAFRACVLMPLGPQGSHLYRERVFDHTTDSPVEAPLLKAPEDAILLCDGIFLQRQELVEDWDFVIFLQISTSTSLERARKRDLALLHDLDTIDERYQKRYIPAQQFYLTTCQPQLTADMLIDNEDLANPFFYHLSFAITAT
jgi:uridine kinase